MCMCRLSTSAYPSMYLFVSFYFSHLSSGLFYQFHFVRPNPFLLFFTALSSSSFMSFCFSPLILSPLTRPSLLSLSPSSPCLLLPFVQIARTVCFLLSSTPLLFQFAIPFPLSPLSTLPPFLIIPILSPSSFFFLSYQFSIPLLPPFPSCTSSSLLPPSPTSPHLPVLPPPSKPSSSVLFPPLSLSLPPSLPSLSSTPSPNSHSLLLSSSPPSFFLLFHPTPSIPPPFHSSPTPPLFLSPLPPPRT